jgi:hypothetical protein
LETRRRGVHGVGPRRPHLSIRISDEDIVPKLTLHLFGMEKADREGFVRYLERRTRVIPLPSEVGDNELEEEALKITKIITEATELHIPKNDLQQIEKMGVQRAF